MSHIDIVFDGPPGPEAGRFVEVEDATGKSISFGEWTKRPDGYWALRFKTPVSETQRTDDRVIQVRQRIEGWQNESEIEHVAILRDIEGIVHGK